MNKIKGVIFDLDQTLIDSSSALHLRRNRLWNRVYEQIPYFTVYSNINELINELRENDIKICIVTSSPRPYCQRVLQNFGWEFMSSVCYHDTNRRKPHRDPMDRALELLELESDEVISIGDDINDMISSNEANIISIGVTWGINNSSLHDEADYVFDDTGEFRNFILDNI
ncbi:HAD family hydrolase [Clostridium perfringens]|uniref:HAD family hydrolase n=1 Tax=Clostridium perfringens TaxID=1502 RepID=UPI000F8E0053|nr:HAD family hydrolase [Clostridium perfringens]RUR40472.1 HAD family hydrolase [Clostridium perfringens]